MIWRRLRSWLAAPAVVRAASLDLLPQRLSGTAESETRLTRRAVLGGIAAAVAAPAIVRFDSIMPVRAMPDAELLNGMLANPGSLYAELMEVTRKAFVPRLFVQVWREAPLAQLLDRQVRVGTVGGRADFVMQRC